MSTVVASVGTITSPTKTSQNHKLVFDGERYWVFYMKSGTANTLFYAYSTDLATWYESSVALGGTVVTDGGSIDVLFWTNGTDKLILVSYYSNSNPYRYLCGTISGTTISWTSNSNYINSTGKNSNGDYGVHFTVAGADYPIFSYGNANGNPQINDTTMALSTSFNPGEWTSPGGSTINDYIQRTSIHPLSTSIKKMLLIIDDDDAIKSSIITSGSYGSLATVINGSGYSRTNWGSCHISITSIWFLGQNGSSAFGFRLHDGSSWSTKTAPSWPTSGLATNSGVGLITDGTDIYAIVIRGDANKSVAYNKYTVSTDSWGGWNDVVTTTKTRSYISVSGTNIANGVLPVTWTEVNGSNYDLVVENMLPASGYQISGNVTAQAATATGSITVRTACSGAVSAQAAMISGSIGVRVACAGEVTAQSATISGNLEIVDALELSGAVSAQAATASGDIAVRVACSGAVSAQASTASGAVAVRVAVSGAVQAQSATATGSIEHVSTVDISGSVQAQAATASGNIAVRVALSGAVQAQAATTTGQVSAIPSIGGAVQAQSATATGNIAVRVSCSGAVSAQAATASGNLAAIASLSGSVQAQAASASGDLAVRVACSGAVSAQAATATGDLAVRVAVSGSVQAQSATATGTITTDNSVNLSGNAQAQSATASGDIAVRVACSGAVSAQAASATGTVSAIVSASGAVQAQSATANGNIAVRVSLSGGVQAQSATASGTLTTEWIASVSGAVQAQAATAAGTVTITVSASGNAQPQAATASGSIAVTVTASGAVSAQDATTSGVILTQEIIRDIVTLDSAILLTVSLQSSATRILELESLVR